MLDSVPCLNPAVRWQELESGCLMAVYHRHARGLRNWVQALMGMPRVGQLVLDEPGTRVVKRIDGTRTVNDLIEFVAAEFQLSRKESEVSTLKYMEMLGRRGMVGFRIRPEANEG